MKSLFSSLPANKHNGHYLMTTGSTTYSSMLSNDDSDSGLGAESPCSNVPAEHSSPPPEPDLPSPEKIDFNSQTLPPQTCSISNSFKPLPPSVTIYPNTTPNILCRSPRQRKLSNTSCSSTGSPIKFAPSSQNTNNTTPKIPFKFEIQPQCRNTSNLQSSVNTDVTSIKDSNLIADSSLRSPNRRKSSLSLRKNGLLSADVLNRMFSQDDIADENELDCLAGIKSPETTQTYVKNKKKIFQKTNNKENIKSYLNDSKNVTCKPNLNKVLTPLIGHKIRNINLNRRVCDLSLCSCHFQKADDIFCFVKTPFKSETLKISSETEPKPNGHLPEANNLMNIQNSIGIKNQFHHTPPNIFDSNAKIPEANESQNQNTLQRLLPPPRVIRYPCPKSFSNGTSTNLYQNGLSSYTCRWKGCDRTVSKYAPGINGIVGGLQSAKAAFQTFIDHLIRDHLKPAVTGPITNRVPAKNSDDECNTIVNNDLLPENYGKVVVEGASHSPNHMANPDPGPNLRPTASRLCARAEASYYSQLQLLKAANPKNADETKTKFNSLNHSRKPGTNHKLKEGTINEPKLPDQLTDTYSHVASVSYKNSTTTHTYTCLWEGCKFYERPVRSINWIRNHVMYHVSPKPYKCIIGSCAAAFRYHSSLEHHINQRHLKNSASNTMHPTSCLTCNQDSNNYNHFSNGNQTGNPSNDKSTKDNNSQDTLSSKSSSSSITPESETHYEHMADLATKKRKKAQLARMSEFWKEVKKQRKLLGVKGRSNKLDDQTLKDIEKFLTFGNLCKPTGLKRVDPIPQHMYDMMGDKLRSTYSNHSRQPALTSMPK